MIANWHNLSIEEVSKVLGGDIEDGLTENEVLERQVKFGQNVLPEEKSTPRLRIFLEQFASPLIYILLIAGIIVLFFKDYTDFAVIMGAVILNTIIGYLQENKATKALAELKKIVKHRAKVLRQGNIKIVDSSELVPGDIFILKPGDKVPADGRLIEVRNLKINEMVLTGEWLSAKKHSDILEKETPMADRDNMVYMGTIVEDGKAKAIVTAVGSESEIGRIAAMVREAKEEKTPYQKKLSHLSKFVGAIIAVMSIGIFIEGILTGGDFIEMFITAVAVAVAAIPEGLPVAMTVILALGMQRILKKKGLIRKLAAAETLGSTSVICTDKTATLTQGKIKVTKILTRAQIFGYNKAIQSRDQNLVFKMAVLCNESFIENEEAPREEWIVRGRPTDKALLSFGLEHGFSKKALEKQFTEIDELPFDNKRKLLATLRKRDRGRRGNVLFVAGAPENLLEMSKLKPEEKEKWVKELENMASKGFRMIALAKKNTAKERIKDIAFQDLDIVALLELSDPLRKEVKKAIRICRQTGMRTIIVTGDHKLTAKAIAKELGFKLSRTSIMEGKELDELSDKEFQKRLKKIKIFARVEPRHKMRIVEAWQERGEVVAMTGDGINDAPALKKADIGVALGSGTEVAKETADLILLNDSFSIIVAAVEEGRAMIDNIRKVVTYLLSDSFTEVILIGVSILLGAPLPIIAVQILWVNLIEDGPLALSLAFEPKEKDLMKQRFQGHNVPLLTKEMKVLIFIIGLISDLFLLGLFFWLIKYSGYEISHIRSIIFVGLTIDSIFYVFSCKSLRRSIWHINPFSNKFLIASWTFGAIALLAALYLPPLQALLRTVPLNFFDWQLMLSLGLLNVALIEFTKHYFIVRHQTQS